MTGREWVRDPEQEAAFQRMADRAWEKHLAEIAKRKLTPTSSYEHCDLSKFTDWTTRRQIAAALGIGEKPTWPLLQKAIARGELECKRNSRRTGSHGAPPILYRWVK